MAMSKIVESNNLILEKTAFFLCDIQEKFKPAIDHFNEMVEVSQRLVTLRYLFKTRPLCLD